MRWDSEFEPSYEPVQSSNDKELTLGPGLLTALGLGLLALCCICFLAGYSVGHRSAAAVGLKVPAAAPTGPSAAELLEQSKPAAAQNTPAQPAAQPLAVSQPLAAQEPAAAPTAATPQLQPASQTVTPAPYNTSQQAPAANPLVHPALAQATPQSVSWIVQIAAVEHTEDATVLVDALRRRGYAVSVRQDPMDNLFHVFVGPFAGRSQADSMRTRLEGDGYNAVLLP
jgi:DedD protein